jgi:hypothetical protein
MKVVAGIRYLQSPRYSSCENRYGKSRNSLPSTTGLGEMRERVHLVPILLKKSTD